MASIKSTPETQTMRVTFEEFSPTHDFFDYRGKKGSVRRPGNEMRSMRKHAEGSDWRDEFHAAALVRGGERSWISAVVSRSMTLIDPPHLGQG